VAQEAAALEGQLAEKPISTSSNVESIFLKSEATSEYRRATDLPRLVVSPSLSLAVFFFHMTPCPHYSAAGAVLHFDT
jgi:hypothetical protein